MAMALTDDSRRAVYELIESPQFFARVRDDWNKVSLRIREWFSKYKDFERADRFYDAFDDDRMTVRFIKQKEVIKNFHAWNRDALLPAVVTTRTKFVGTIGNVRREEVRTLSKVDSAEYKETGLQLDTTIEGLCARMVPEAFDGGPANRMKYDDGLHDLSASLLSRSRTISHQVFNRSLETGAVLAFMPLSLPEDQVLFQKLNSLAKESARHQNAEFTKLICHIRSRMTRIKLACEGDISANYVDVAPSTADFPKYKYGIGVWSKVKNEQNIEVQKYVGEDEVARRKRLTLDFRQILTPDKVNEIIVAYRHHENPRFPVFATLQVAEHRGVQEYVYHTFEAGGRGIKGGVLSDVGGGLH